MLAGHDPGAAIVTLRGETMGTSWSAQIAASAAADLAPVEHAIRDRLDGLVVEMSHWEPSSLLCRFNRASGGHWSALPHDFRQVIARALDIADATDGAFDPAIGHLVDLWGFGPPGPRPAPDAAMLEQARKRSGWHHLAFDAEAGRLRQPGGVALDLSGIAKGYGVDALSALLMQKGLRHHLVEIGGELAGRGIRPDGEPWWVDLETPPGAEGTLAPIRIALHGLAVATSGNYVRGAHTIDPRNGLPVENGCVSVSVVASCAMDADGWASALTVMGMGAALTFAAQRGLAARIVMAGESGAVTEHLSPALIAMLAD